MKKYNFDEIIDRRGTSSLKYDFGIQRKGRDDLLPLWVADMDFKLPSVVLDDLHKRISHGIFGYTDPDEEYFEALNYWFKKYHNYTVDPNTVTLGCGIVYGIATAVKSFTNKGDSVIIQQPVYYPFRECIEDNDRLFVNNQLILENNKYKIDFKDFEEKIIDNNVKMFILCNPHNPVGRVWNRDELTKLLDICYKHKVVVLSDEIHCDLIYKGNKFTSVFNLDDKYKEIIVLMTSPSKTFNIAGFQPSNIIIPNENLRMKFRKEKAKTGYSQGSLMGQVALIACYKKGEEWYLELLDYLEDNLNYFRKFIKEKLPMANLIEPEGTYLLWVDFSNYNFTADELDDIIINDAKLWLDSGKIFGVESEKFQRFNIACPRSTLEKALESLQVAINTKK
ncbi:pyridoxal phosphate-dependent aminotransferase [Peptoniphilus sp. AGMB00490]|uniref:Pyridoxal phosphate-dependent aminotransferase n=2 Tax=Peptoniphilus TaxID=162289 RepID=A0ACD6AZB9_9FIRM|nr:MULTISPECIES: MalY/PatB family protein [Peptoniphilus]NMW85715.1 pyridoxal phosphate-dependent aminotransferase [Peptoniphilus faecalis]OLR64829.1 aminotransferase [Peptoniphilus porci]